MLSFVVAGLSLCAVALAFPAAVLATVGGPAVQGCCEVETLMIELQSSSPSGSAAGYYNGNGIPTCFDGVTAGICDEIADDLDRDTTFNSGYICDDLPAAWAVYGEGGATGKSVGCVDPTRDGRIQALNYLAEDEDECTTNPFGLNPVKIAPIGKRIVLCEGICNFTGLQLRYHIAQNNLIGRFAENIENLLDDTKCVFSPQPFTVREEGPEPKQLMWYASQALISTDVGPQEEMLGGGAGPVIFVDVAPGVVIGSPAARAPALGWGGLAFAVGVLLLGEIRRRSRR
jgi:hypothetical protein